MHRLAGFALIFLSLVHAAPQGIGAVICDSTAITDWQYKNSQPPQDVTNTFGDQGWENYDAILCTAAASCESAVLQIAGRILTVHSLLSITRYHGDTHHRHQLLRRRREQPRNSHRGRPRLRCVSILVHSQVRVDRRAMPCRQRPKETMRLWSAIQGLPRTCSRDQNLDQRVRKEDLGTVRYHRSEDCWCPGQC